MQQKHFRLTDQQILKTRQKNPNFNSTIKAIITLEIKISYTTVFKNYFSPENVLDLSTFTCGFDRTISINRKTRQWNNILHQQNKSKLIKFNQHINGL